MNNFNYGVARWNEDKPFMLFETFNDADNFANTNRNIDRLIVCKKINNKWAICVDEYIKMRKKEGN